jgi:prepilin-type N-terminal cleavage/methylation domain-containing protein/prepilin-type processing-associated H-X9-DG protein
MTFARDNFISAGLALRKWHGHLVHASQGRLAPARLSFRGFTLVELLVVIAIISLLITILVPSLMQARAVNRRTVCLNNIRGIGLATQLYVTENSYFPPAWISGTSRWMDLIKPYADKKSGLYRCPSDAKQQAVVWDPEIIMSYGINTFNFKDNAHCFWYGVKADLVRRPAGTIIFADCTPGYYYCGGGKIFAEPVTKVDYRHSDGFNVVYCDGRAEWRTMTTKPDWDASQ